MTAPTTQRLPTFDELPVVAGAPPQSAWWMFGRDDQVGMFNLQTPEAIVDAARLVRRGAMFPLNWELELPNPPLYGRGALRQTILRRPTANDDVLDNFFPQASSQWDSLIHVGHSQYGFYNGLTQAEITGEPGSRGGIENWARRGIAGRGVLLDIGRYLASQGTPLDCGTDTRFTPDQLEACRLAQGVDIRSGDVLIIRTGWTSWYLEQDVVKRRELSNRDTLRAPGLLAGEAMARYLWDLHVSAIASDVPPSRRGRPRLPPAASCTSTSSASSAWPSASSGSSNTWRTTVPPTAATSFSSPRPPSTSWRASARRRTRSRSNSHGAAAGSPRVPRGDESAGRPIDARAPR
jgi:hypothetical protein